VVDAMKNILIIEDDKDINNLISEVLTKNGYTCTQAFTGTEGLMCVARESYSLILLDLMLPNLCGEVLLPEIRKSQEVPVIVMSAKDSIDSKVQLLNSGADDYITKPFDLNELVARVGVQIRRYDTTPSNNDTLITFKDLVLNKSNFDVTVKNENIILTKHEFKILELLIANPDKVFSKQDIYDYAWEDYYIGEDKTVNVHISNIRRKIRQVTDTEYIETVWGIGFKLKK
jgi:DNA-binding response OmpR family regulator